MTVVREAWSADPIVTVEQTPEIAFARLTDEILSDNFQFQPLQAVGLGLHQYDGKFPDVRMTSVQAEIGRLHSFQRQLEAIDHDKLSVASLLDWKLLRQQVRLNLFQAEAAGTYDRNPMTYAEALDLNAYLKRDFAPLADRLRAIVQTEEQVPAMFAAAHENLADVLPKPMVELAVDIAKGGAEFLTHDLVEAVKDVQDPALQAE